MAKKTTAPAPKKTATNDDLFDALAGDAEKVDTKKPKSRKEKPQIDLSETEEKAFEALCAADVVYKMAEGKQKAAKSLVVPILRRKLLENGWAAVTRPIIRSSRPARHGRTSWCGTF